MSDSGLAPIFNADQGHSAPVGNPVNIDLLTEQELIDLNRRIVERLRLMQQVRAHKHMLDFRVGQRVRFTANARTIEGTLTRYNRKTVIIITDDGEHWNVAPALVQSSEH